MPQLSQSSIYAQYGFTKLFKTAGRGNVTLVKELIKKGADVNIKNLVSLYVDLAFKFEMSLSGHVHLSLALLLHSYTHALYLVLNIYVYVFMFTYLHFTSVFTYAF